MRITAKLLFVSLSVMFIIVGSVFVVAYANGRKVVDTPEVQWVSHTEYWSSSGVGASEVASTIVRLTDYQGNPFTVNSCTAMILYPNKTAYVSGASMNQSSIPGNWYRTDIIPATEGTYEQEVTCSYGGGKTIKTAQSFHVNPALNFIKNVDADVLTNGAAISDVNVTLKARIADANDSITSRVSLAQTTLHNLLNNLNSTVFAELSRVNATVNTHLENVNMSLDAHLAGTQAAIQAQLSNTNASLTSLINTVYNSLYSYMVLYLPAINQTTTSIYSDTRWLVSNAMNQQNAADITNRFNAADGNLSLVEQFCRNQQTNSSALCQEVYGIRDVLDHTRAEQTSYFTTLNQTTTNTWNLLSGAVTTKIDSLLENIGVIRGQTTQINDTVVAIRADQTAEVRIQAIA